jgi:hypothetical protein
MEQSPVSPEGPRERMDPDPEIFSPSDALPPSLEGSFAKAAPSPSSIAPAVQVQSPKQEPVNAHNSHEGPSKDESCDDPYPSDPSSCVLSYWREGKPIDQSARELRMGRQEVQLLIEMSRHTPVAVPKG